MRLLGGGALKAALTLRASPARRGPAIAAVEKAGGTRERVAKAAETAEAQA